MDVGHARLTGRCRRRDRNLLGPHRSPRTCTTTAAKRDDHLVPGKGVIDWDAATAGVPEGRLRRRVDVRAGVAAEPAAGARARRVEGARDASRRCCHIERRNAYRSGRGSVMATHVTSTRSASTSATAVTIKGWLHNRRSSGKIHFLVVRDGTGFLQVVMGKKDVDEATFPRPITSSQESAIIITGTVQADERAKGGYEMVASGLEVVTEAHDYPDHAEGARRRLPDGSPPPVDSRRAADRDPARAARDHQRRPRLLQRRRASSSPTRRSSRRPRARARPRCSRSSTSTTRRPT